MLPLLLAMLGGCYNDKGNYEYKAVPKVTVTGIKSSYTFSVSSTQVIRPQISYEGAEITNPAYTWRVGRQVIGEEKDLEFEVFGLPVRAGQFSEFVITDMDTGVEYSTLFTVDVESEFQSGWVILADDGDRSALHYMRDDGEFYPDIYRESNNGQELSPKPFALAEHFLPWSYDLGQIFVACQGGPEYSVELDGNTFQRVVATREEFVGDMPAGFSPMNMCCVSNYDYLVSDGKLYVRHVQESYDALYQDGLFPNFPVPGDYRLSGWFTRGSLMFSNDAIMFDEVSQSYVLVRDGEISRFDYVNDPNQKFVPYEMGKRVLDGGPTSTATPVDHYVTFLRDDSDGTVYVHRFYFTGWSAKAYRSTSEEIFPMPEIIGDDSRFAVCQNRPYVYISSGTVLYIYNYNDNTVRQVKDFGQQIRDIAICRANYERLGMALENSSDPSTSDFMEVNVSIAEEGRVVMSRTGIAGRAVDVIYKLGGQWTTY